MNKEQADVVTFVLQGHNVLVTGQAGVGKSTVVESILADAKKRNRKVAVVCSTGKACEVYKPGVAITVNSFYGFLTAELPWKNVIERAIMNDKVRERVKATDIIVWDEASMSSSRMLELVNNIHIELAEPENKCYPFGGKQMIIVGEFLQLNPVPSYFDKGNFMFLAPLFTFAISHRIQLTTVMRQNKSEREFLSALNQVRLGVCSDETDSFLISLARPLSYEDDHNALHIFFRKVPSMLYNRAELDKLPGDICRFDVICEGKTNNMKCPCDDVLFLKENAKVMLVWNLSHNLINGVLGVFLRVVSNDTIEVYFPKQGTVLLKRETWFNHNKQGQTIGTKSQFPVILAYGITCHKSQALTLSAAVVHCSREFVPGLTYVAMSRVRSADHLQLLWFNRNWLLQPSDRTISECCTNFGCPVEDLTCCRKKVIDDSRLIEVMDRNDEPEDYLEYDNPDVPIVDAATMDSIVEDYFERPGFDTPIHLSLVHDQLVKHESDLAKPVVDLIDVNEILASLKVKCPTSDFAKEKNSSIELLLTYHKENVHIFANIIWYHSFLLIKSYIEENTEEVVVDMSRQRFTLVTGKFHQLLGSEVYAEYISGLWDTTEYSRVKKSISSQIAIDIYWKFMDHLSKVVKKEMEITPMQFNVQEMSAAGRAKLRHVGAWAVRKVLERSRKYVRENIFTENSYTLQKVYEQQCKCELLEEYIVVPFSQIENTTKFPETLEVTENRQYRSRGLLHISDSSYMFFVALESLRVSLMNNAKLSVHRDKMVEAAHNEMTKNESLKLEWKKCFSSEIDKHNEQKVCVLNNSA